MRIGAVPNHEGWERWEEARALLEPARARGDFPSVIEPDEALFAVMEGDELLAVATAWLGEKDGRKFVEVKLLGGRDYKRWLGELDRVIGNAARDAGATQLVGIGRLGWARALDSLGWAKSKKIEDHWLFTREL